MPIDPIGAVARLPENIKDISDQIGEAVTYLMGKGLSEYDATMLAIKNKGLMGTLKGKRGDITLPNESKSTDIMTLDKPKKPGWSGVKDLKHTTRESDPTSVPSGPLGRIGNPQGTASEDSSIATTVRTPFVGSTAPPNPPEGPLGAEPVQPQLVMPRGPTPAPQLSTGTGLNPMQIELMKRRLAQQQGE